jgi:hypothetical protein
MHQWRKIHAPSDDRPQMATLLRRDPGLLEGTTIDKQELDHLSGLYD